MTMNRARYAAAAALLMGSMVLAATALGGSGIAFFGPPDDAPSVEAQLGMAVSTTMPNGHAAALWVAPTTEGGRCAVLAVGADASTVAPSPEANSGGWCERPPIAPQPPIAATINWLNPAGGHFEVALAGEISAADITEIELQSPSGDEALPLEDGLFVGALPTSDAAGELPQGGPYVLVGRDEHGSEVARLDLALLLERARP
jgi:hypothetical protein